MYLTRDHIFIAIYVIARKECVLPSYAYITDLYHTSVDLEYMVTFVLLPFQAGDSTSTLEIINNFEKLMIDSMCCLYLRSLILFIIYCLI